MGQEWDEEAGPGTKGTLPFESLWENFTQMNSLTPGHVAEEQILIN